MYLAQLLNHTALLLLVDLIDHTPAGDTGIGIRTIGLGYHQQLEDASSSSSHSESDPIIVNFTHFRQRKDLEPA